jgi:hypothetical protein
MSRQPEVDGWFEQYDNPMKDVVPRVRSSNRSSAPGATGATPDGQAPSSFALSSTKSTDADLRISRAIIGCRMR